ncbi:MAG TPA: phosphatase PAP2-related protein [Puia sp.]|nr:phosphatase PAP2-related protein [Puia sp.]
MPPTILITLRQEWQEAWQEAGFRRKLITGLVVVALIAMAFPIFFQSIEKRNGIVVHDLLLSALPPYDVSVPIFVIIWATFTLTLIRCIQNPDMLLVFLWAYIFVSLARFLTITLVPLSAPEGLIGLADPLVNRFYGSKYVTKDLFFSGHTSTLFLMYLCLVSRTDRMLALAGTMAVGILLLVQHVHYTLDVLLAFPFTWAIWRMVKRTLLLRSRG